jgi:acetyl esterase/lipase
MDLFTPTDPAPSGAAVIVVVSGGWFSSHDSIGPVFINLFARPFLDRGYTVLAVVPASQPKFTIPEIASHLDRAVRYTRAHADELGIDPNRIGITGGSAGGHLSLLQATSPTAAKKLSLDPVEQVSGQVQAAAVFFPPTDFLNWGKPDHRILDDAMIPPFRAAFDYHEMSEETKMFERIEDRKRVDELLRQTSPLYHATKKTPPTLIIHGDADTLVPIQQAEIFIDKLKELGVPAELQTRPGAGHGWLNMQEDVKRCADFFDKHLAPKM